MAHDESGEGNLSVLVTVSFENSGISVEAVRVFTWVVFTVVCQAINMFGIATNNINIMCFVRQGFNDSINISLLGM